MTDYLDLEDAERLMRIVRAVRSSGVEVPGLDSHDIDWLEILAVRAAREEGVSVLTADEMWAYHGPETTFRVHGDVPVSAPNASSTGS